MSSSLYFPGNQSSYLRVNDPTGLMNFGNGVFTIEWYQLQTDTHLRSAHIFQLGSGGVGSLSVSISGGDVYMGSYGLINGQTQYVPIRLTNTGIMNTYRNQWTYVAVSRCSAGGDIVIYVNGTLVASQSVPSIIVGQASNTLYIGNASSGSLQTAFGGWLYYFNVSRRGIATLHGMPNCVSTFVGLLTYAPATNADTVLNLSGSGSTGGLSGQVSTLGQVVPFSYTPAGGSPTPYALFRLDRFQPNFTDNARVFYKPGSLASGGTGTVRNSRAKARFT